MKKIFYILYGMLLMTGAFTITSCLSDDNDSDDYEGITPEDYTYYMNQMTGDYTGKLFFAGENLNELDSIATTATVTGVGDSCVYVSVPLVNLARGTNDDWLKAAAEEEGGNVTLAIKYYLYRVKDGDVFFGAYPQFKYGDPDSTKKTVSLTYDGETHDVDFWFYCNTNYNGEFYRDKLQVYFYLVGIQVDGSTVSNLTVSSSYLSPESYFRVLLTKF
ncbi:MAG: DUF4840 domain-containing protein [Prevotella sp.]|nr:DUF4840 domain-containing protein [Prevotella sp.]